MSPQRRQGRAHGRRSLGACEASDGPAAEAGWQVGSMPGKAMTPAPKGPLGSRKSGVAQVSHLAFTAPTVAPQSRTCSLSSLQNRQCSAKEGPAWLLRTR